MRRSVVLALATVAVTAAALGGGIPAASAHICASPVEIPVGRAATVDVGVTVEQATVPDVEILVPAGLRLDQADTRPAWTVTRSGSTLRYRGGPILAFQCEFFSIRVTAPATGTFGITVIQRDAAGTVVARSAPDPANPGDRLGQFVYAGVKIPSPPGTSSGPSLVVIAGIALVGLGAVMAVVAFVRSRRAPSDDGHDEPGAGSGLDAELQARLDRFKKQKPDRPPPA